jgi:hypothetical protein
MSQAQSLRFSNSAVCMHLNRPQTNALRTTLCQQVATAHPPEAIHKILECLGLPSRPPPIAHALPDHEVEELDFS